MSEDEKATVGRLRAQHECGLMGLPPNHKVVSYGNAADALDRIARERDEARAEIERLRNGGVRDQTTTQFRPGFGGGGGAGSPKTAPKEGTRILSGTPYSCEVAYWADDCDVEQALPRARAALAPATPAAPDEPPPQKDAAP
jgi:hypothetical protein